MKTREDLAREVIRMLDTQKSYFRLRPDDPGKRVALERSKSIEKSLRLECEGILKELPLFSGEDDR